MASRSRWLDRQSGADLVALTVLIGGLVGSFALGRSIAGEELRADAAEFDRRVLARRAAIETAFARAVDTTVALSGLLDASDEVTEREFTRFAAPLLARHAELHALEWVPRVIDAARADHVAAAREDGHTGYTIRSIDDAAPTSVSWPVRYVAPLDSNRPALGLDLASEPTRRRALEASVRSRAPVATEPIALVQGRGQAGGVIVFHPVFERGPGVRGVVAGVLDLPALLAAVDATQDMDGIDARLTHPASGVTLRATGDATAPPSDARFSSRSVITLPGLQLDLVAAPLPSFSAGRRAVAWWWIWLGGSVISLLLALGFKDRGDQTRSLLVLAEAVSEANRALEDQVAERERAEEAVRLLNEELRERVELGTQEIETKNSELTVAQRRLEEEQRHAAMLAGQRLESLGLLAGGVAHDFNNLLTTILGQASLLGEQQRLPEAARNSATQIELAAQRAAELVRQLLTYAGRAEPRVETMYVSDVVLEIRRLVDASLSKKAELVLDLDDDLPPVEVDGTQMRQVLMNLITNASDALGGKPGTIRVGTRLVELIRPPEGEPGWVMGPPPPGRYVAVQIADDGVGMDAAAVERMFEPFYTTKATGHGLGLAAVLGVIRQVSGRIRVLSAIGEGTTIDLLLPAGKEEPGDATASWIDELPDLNGVRVLLVDDEAPVRALVRAVLSRVGCIVTEAEDGVEALEQFQIDPSIYDIVILDMVMPRMDGPETLRALRSLRADVPILLSSGYSNAQLDELPLGEHSGFLAKPYRARDLIAAVRDSLGALVPGADSQRFLPFGR